MSYLNDEAWEPNKKKILIPAVILAALAVWFWNYVIKAADVSGDVFLIREYGSVCLLAIGIAAVAGIFLYCSSIDRKLIWLGCALAFGILCMRVLPGLSGPDEPTHYITAYALSDTMLFQQARDEDGRVMIRARDYVLEDMDKWSESEGTGTDADDGALSEPRIFGQKVEEQTYRELKYWSIEHKEYDKGMVPSMRTGVITTPVVYIPQALGITLARILNMNSVWLINLGRFFNLAVYLILVYFAVCRMPFGGDLMMASAMLPMSINLSATMSYDAMLIGLSYVYISEVFRLSYGTDIVGPRDIAILAGTIGLLAPCKMVYTVMIILLLLIPSERYARKPDMVLTWALSAGLAAVHIALVESQVIAGFAAASSNELLYAGGEEGWTIRHIIHHPGNAATICFDTLMWQLDYWHDTLIGRYLGNTDTGLDVPYFVILILTCSLGLLALGTRSEDPECDSNGLGRLSKKDRVLIAVLGILLTGLFIGAMFISWTPLNSPVVQGVQGRYFIPVLPVLLMLFHNKLLKFEKDPSAGIFYAMILCDSFVFIRLFAMIALKI